MGTFFVEIPNLPLLIDALAAFPAIAQPILEKAIPAALAILAKYTTPATVPVRTGYLVNNWGQTLNGLKGSWYPKAAYASYVEFGTRPHTILAVNARVLANQETGQIFGPAVNHPGTQANPFIERIMAAAQPEITSTFETALAQIMASITTPA